MSRIICSGRVMSHIWMSHVARMNEACCAYEWGMSHTWINYLTRMNESFHKYERGDGMRLVSKMSHFAHQLRWMSHITRINESCNTHEWGMPRELISHVSNRKESCHTHEGDMSHTNGHKCERDTPHIWRGDGMRIKSENIYAQFTHHLRWMSCHSYEWVMSCTWLRHVTHMNESYHTYDIVMPHMWKGDRMRIVSRWVMSRIIRDEWVMSLVWIRHVAHINESCHARKWVMSHVWKGGWNAHSLQNESCHASSVVNESCHSYEWGMPLLWMCHVTRMYESCHTCTGVKSHICMSHVTHMNKSCHWYECAMPYARMSHAARTHETCPTYERVVSHMWMSHVTRMNESRHNHS